MLDTESSVYSAASELGIDVNSLDEGSDLDTIETESMEAASDDKKEEGSSEEEFSSEDSEDPEQALEGEEKEVVQAPVEEVKEEPKLTAKEFQEIAQEKEVLAKERQAFMEEKAQVEKDLREQFTEKAKSFDEIDSFFANLAAKDPELFDLVKGEFQEHQKQYSNPVLDQVKTKMEALEKELSQFKSKASDEVTLTKLDTEMNKFLSTTGKEAETAGIKIDRKVIEDMWAKGLTVEEAFHAKYGAAYAKALVSKTKVDTAEKKVQARPSVATAGSVQRANGPVKANVPTNAYDAVRYYAKQITGKA